jgi:hypothetical protein
MAKSAREEGNLNLARNLRGHLVEGEFVFGHDMAPDVRELLTQLGIAELRLSQATVEENTEAVNVTVRGITRFFDIEQVEVVADFASPAGDMRGFVANSSFTLKAIFPSLAMRTIFRVLMRSGALTDMQVVNWEEVYDIVFSPATMVYDAVSDTFTFTGEADHSWKIEAVSLRLDAEIEKLVIGLHTYFKQERRGRAAVAEVGYSRPRTVMVGGKAGLGPSTLDFQIVFDSDSTTAPVLEAEFQSGTSIKVAELLAQTVGEKIEHKFPGKATLPDMDVSVAKVQIPLDDSAFYLHGQTVAGGTVKYEARRQNGDRWEYSLGLFMPEGYTIASLMQDISRPELVKMLEPLHVDISEATLIYASRAHDSLMLDLLDPQLGSYSQKAYTVKPGLNFAAYLNLNTLLDGRVRQALEVMDFQNTPDETEVQGYFSEQGMRFASNISELHWGTIQALNGALRFDDFVFEIRVASGDGEAPQVGFSSSTMRLQLPVLPELVASDGWLEIGQTTSSLKASVLDLNEPPIGDMLAKGLRLSNVQLAVTVTHQKQTRTLELTGDYRFRELTGRALFYFQGTAPVMLMVENLGQSVTDEAGWISQELTLATLARTFLIDPVRVPAVLENARLHDVNLRIIPRETVIDNEELAHGYHFRGELSYHFLRARMNVHLLPESGLKAWGELETVVLQDAGTFSLGRGNVDDWQRKAVAGPIFFVDIPTRASQADMQVYISAQVTLLNSRSSETLSVMPEGYDFRFAVPLGNGKLDLSCRYLHPTRTLGASGEFEYHLNRVLSPFDLQKFAPEIFAVADSFRMNTLFFGELELLIKEPEVRVQISGHFNWNGLAFYVPQFESTIEDFAHLDEVLVEHIRQNLGKIFTDTLLDTYWWALAIRDGLIGASTNKLQQALRIVFKLDEQEALQLLKQTCVPADDLVLVMRDAYGWTALRTARALERSFSWPAETVSEALNHVYPQEDAEEAMAEVYDWTHRRR